MPPVERRTFLALGVTALGLVGCTGELPAGPEGGSPPPRQPAEDPDSALRARVAASEAALVARYRDALAMHADLVAELGPFLAHHEAHLARVAPGAASASAAPSTVTPTPEESSDGNQPASPSASASGAPPGGDTAVSASPGASDPDSRAAAVAGLAEAEGVAHRDRVDACDAAENAGLARDLCLIAASEAQHESALTALQERASA